MPEKYGGVQALKLLGNDTVIEILQFIHKHGWTTATEIAKTLNIHTATAVKYLTELFNNGLLSRRIRRCRTRNAFEYDLKETRFSITVDIPSLISKQSEEERERFTLYTAMLFSIAEKSRRFSGPGTIEPLQAGLQNVPAKLRTMLFRGLTMPEIPPEFLEKLCAMAVELNFDLMPFVTALIIELTKYNERKVGERSTAALVRASLAPFIEKNSELIKKHNLFSGLPEKYFGGLIG